MPLIAWGYGGFAAGLIAGFAGVMLSVIGLATLAAWTLSRPTLPNAGVFLLFGAGVLIVGSSPATSTWARHQKRSPSTGLQGLLDRQRARADTTIDSVFIDDAPLAKALLIADQSEIPKDVRDRYAAAGIIHMLSISGLHVAIIAVVVELVFQLLRIPRTIASGATVVVIVLYVAVIGFPRPRRSIGDDVSG